MEQIMDKQIELDGVIIPYCEEGGETWYPIRYVTEKFLMKTSLQLQKNENYKYYITRHVIDYSFKGTSPQETYCMNKNGWIKFLGERKLNKNKDINKIKRHNIFCDYFGCDNNKYIDKTENPIYDDYIKDCINNVLESNANIAFRKCPKCGRELPLHINFFPSDSRVPSGFTGVCKMCKPSCFPIVHADMYARRIYSQFGNDGYLLYIKSPTKFIEEYGGKEGFNELNLHTNTTSYIKEAEKDALLNIVKNDYINNIITKYNLNVYFIKTKYKIKIRYDKMTNNEINEYCSNNDCKVRPWLYPCYKLGSVSFDIGRQIINTYLKDNNIVIQDIFNYKYNDLLKKCKLTQFNNNILDFIVKYYDYQYAGYKFKISAVNYYKSNELRIFDMKWLIEKDLKIEIPKIPLYITKTLLNMNYKPLYHVLNKSYYNGSLFKWIDECYPNNFVELDFNINPYRNIFDSNEEAQVDRVLREKCNNVIYNIRNSDNEVTVLGIKPDWIILGNKGTMFVEYFGLYIGGGNEYKERLEIYKNKTDKKYTKYGELLKIGYKHLYIYPNDLKNNFEGLHKKLKAIG